MITIQQIIEELKKYDEDAATLYNGIPTPAITSLAEKVSYPLPESLVGFLQTCNGFRIGYSRAVFGIHDDEILDIYENYHWETTAPVNPLPKNLLPISPNGLGDYYCLDLTTIDQHQTDCKIVFWQHDNYIREEHPVVADGFLTFVWDMLVKSQKEIAYDGSFK